IVLDENSGLDVQMVERDGAVGAWAVLPPGVCRKWGSGAIVDSLAVASTRCLRRSADQPVCTAAQRGCASGRGWDGTGTRGGQGDAGLDGGEGGGGASCSVYPNASALWANEQGAIVMASNS